MTTLNIAHKLERSLVFTTQDVNKALEGLGKEGRDVDKPTEEVPELTNEHIGQESGAIPPEYWQLQCWGCRDKGHTTFYRPVLTIPQR